MRFTRSALTATLMFLSAAVSHLGAQVRVEKDRPVAASRGAAFKCTPVVRTTPVTRDDSLFAALVDQSADTLHRLTDRGTSPGYAKAATACLDSAVKWMLRGPSSPPPVNLPPVARFVVSCSASQCVMDASSSTDDKGIVSYRWTTNSAARPPTEGVRIIRYAGQEAPSAWTETLTVTDASGLTNAVTKDVALAAAPPDTTVPPPVDTAATPADTAVRPPTVALPRYVPSDARPAVTGRTIRVAACGDLQAALDTARRGDLVLVSSSLVCTGNFTIARKTAGAGFLWVRSDAPDANLPVQGVRFTPAHAPVVATIRSTNSAPALELADARFVRLEYLNVECVNAGPPAINYNCIALGSTRATTRAAQAGNIVLSHLWLHGNSATNMQRCVGLNADTTAITDSWISDCHAAGFDAQAIAGWNGAGPFKIDNNYLEGSGENIMFGGADPAIQGLVPEDITVTHNHFFKPAAWKGRWTVKNLEESKNGRRQEFRGNVFDGNWADAQQGFAVLWKSSNQDGTAPWSQSADVTFHYNIVRNSPAGLTVSATESPPYDGVPAARFYVAHNFFENIGTFNATANGRQFMLLGGISDVTIEKTTTSANYTGAGAFLILDNPGPTGARVALTNNVSNVAGPYGAIIGSGVSGSAALQWYIPGFQFTGNVVAGLPSSLIPAYPAGNSWPASLPSVLPPGVGADMSSIARETAGVVIPWPASNPRTLLRGAPPADWWQKACQAPGDRVAGDVRGVGRDSLRTVRESESNNPCAARGMRRPRAISPR